MRATGPFVSVDVGNCTWSRDDAIGTSLESQLSMLHDNKVCFAIKSMHIDQSSLTKLLKRGLLNYDHPHDR